MRYRRADVVDHAIAVLDAYGLADLTMRRLGAELGVQPSALYHHFANKQALLAAVADEILVRGARTRPPRVLGRPGRRDLHRAARRDARLPRRRRAGGDRATPSGSARPTPYDDLAAALARRRPRCHAGPDRRPHPAALRLRSRRRRADPPPGRFSAGAIDDEPRDGLRLRRWGSGSWSTGSGRSLLPARCRAAVALASRSPRRTRTPTRRSRLARW